MILLLYSCLFTADHCRQPNIVAVVPNITNWGPLHCVVCCTTKFKYRKNCKIYQLPLKFILASVHFPTKYQLSVLFTPHCVHMCRQSHKFWAASEHFRGIKPSVERTRLVHSNKKPLKYPATSATLCKKPVNITDCTFNKQKYFITCSALTVQQTAL